MISGKIYYAMLKKWANGLKWRVAAAGKNAVDIARGLWYNEIILGKDGLAY